MRPQRLPFWTAGVIDRDDLAAGFGYPVDFPADLVGVLDGGDHVGGHDQVEMIVGKVPAGWRP